MPSMNDFIRFAAGRVQAQPEETPAQPVVDLAKVEALTDKGLTYADALALVRGPKPPPGNAGAGNNKPPQANLAQRFNQHIRAAWRREGPKAWEDK